MMSFGWFCCSRGGAQGECSTPELHGQPKSFISTCNVISTSYLCFPSSFLPRAQGFLESLALCVSLPINLNPAAIRLQEILYKSLRCQSCHENVAHTELSLTHACGRSGTSQPSSVSSGTSVRPWNLLQLRSLLLFPETSLSRVHCPK